MHIVCFEQVSAVGRFRPKRARDVGRFGIDWCQSGRVSNSARSPSRIPGSMTGVTSDQCRQMCGSHLAVRVPTSAFSAR